MAAFYVTEYATADGWCDHVLRERWHEHVRLTEAYPRHPHPLFPPQFDVMCVDPATHNYRYLYTVRFIEAVPEPWVA